MIVASDLEGTLTSGETWKGAARFLAEHGHARAYRAFFLARLPGALLARAGLRDEQAFRNRWIAELPRLFRGFTAPELRAMAEWIVDHELWPGQRAAPLAELARHRERGGRVVLASATYQPVLEAFARRIGAEAIGTPLEFARQGPDERATGRLAGPVNAGASKAGRLRAFLAGAAPDIAYGDTPADLPMLELSATPVVVGAHPHLGRIARDRGWRVVPI